MILGNLHSMAYDGAKDLHIEQGLIHVKEPGEDETREHIDFNNAFVFPGLINSHDHLDFNFFPQLGNRVYSRYTEWGTDIHESNGLIIESVKKIPKPLRISWGIYKNLLNGVTTVAEHGAKLTGLPDHITVLQDQHTLHSVAFEKKWKYLLNRPYAKKRSFVIHIGEGTDIAAAKEIDSLLRWNIFRKPLIGIHAVAMNEQQAAKFSALVWCPVSNQFLLNKAAPMDHLKRSTTILFGTDSTLTAGWNIWEHIRMARLTGLLNDQELVDALTQNAANTWRLLSGAIAEGRQADLVVAKMNVQRPVIDNFFETDPSSILLVMHKGKIKLYDDSLRDQIPAARISETFSPIHIGSSTKYVIGDIPSLINQVKKYYPAAHFGGII